MATKKYLDQRKSAARKFINKYEADLISKYKHDRMKVWEISRYIAEQVCSGRKTHSTMAIADYCHPMINELCSGITVQ